MSDTTLFAPLHLAHGPAIKNRHILAPLTNCQSGEDGIMSDEEYHWLTLRAQGGFGLVTTCASHVMADGKGFPGQMGCFSDAHLPGLQRLATGLRDGGAVSSLQIHHAGIRAVPGTDIVGPSADAATGARALTDVEVEDAITAFVAAAQRAEIAGFDGVQIHGAHGYLIAAFLSPEFNQRQDSFGGTPENRARFLFEVLHRIRAACGPAFQVGVRISPERFGLVLPEMIDLTQQLLADPALDYLDLSLWDITKEPEDAAFAGQSLMSLFTRLDRGKTALGVAGGIRTGAIAQQALNDGADYVSIGKAAILAHDFPDQVRANPTFAPHATPVTPAFLHSQGISDRFVTYLRRQKNFVTE